MASQMKRVLTVVDVTSLAVGQMIGAGIYVLTGKGVFSVSLVYDSLPDSVKEEKDEGSKRD